MVFDWTVWEAMVQKEKDLFAGLKGGLGDEEREILKILDKWRFIKNTCILLLKHIDDQRNNGPYDPGTVSTVEDLLKDLELAFKKLKEEEKNEYSFTYILEKIIQTGKQFHEELMEQEIQFDKIRDPKT
jgi:hypothetical protein